MRRFILIFKNFSLRGKIITGGLAPLILMVALGVLAISSLGSLKQTNDWVDHTHVVIGEANQILAAAVDMETGMRGFCWPARKISSTPTTTVTKSSSKPSMT